MNFACASNSSCTFGRQGVEFRIEVRMEDDFPSHATNMTLETYAVKGRPADTTRCRSTGGYREVGAARIAASSSTPARSG